MKADVALNHSIYEKRYNTETGDSFYEPFLEILLDVISSAHCKTILDYGCGTGKVARYLEFKGVRHLFKLDGVDISEKAVERGRKYYDDIFLSDGDFFPEDKRYDIILLNSLIEHLEPDRLDNLFRKIEASSNSLFIVVPNFYSIRRILSGRRSELEKERESLGHVNFMSQLEVSRLLGRFGYNSITYSFFHSFKDLKLANYEPFDRFKPLYSLYSLLSLFPFYYCRDSFWVYAKKR